ncbi:uncharacterized protein LOC127287197 [Leptopilina boulardi]|uniref:uncharacterized protein LOC127287197 n=1 Tax=Leptopilina boulardi TaxID=63433 RepID=UPI0021F64DD6|nr:uncharacterized protein LOC127287197 [Leptopilina boulardi]
MPLMRVLPLVLSSAMELSRLSRRANSLQKLLKMSDVHSTTKNSSFSHPYLPRLYRGYYPSRNFLHRFVHQEWKEELSDIIDRTYLMSNDLLGLLEGTIMPSSSFPGPCEHNSFSCICTGTYGTSDRFCLCGRYIRMNYSSYLCQCGHVTFDPNLPPLFIRQSDDGIPCLHISENL